MSPYVFKLPDIGEGVAEAEIVAWHAEIGESIREDQPLVEVMTDKATVVIDSPVSGRLLSRKGEKGERVAIGAELVAIALEEAEAAKPTAAKAAAGVAAPPQPPVNQPPAKPPAAAPSRERRSGTLAAPAVRARAAVLGIDLATVTGSGPDGRIRHRDLDALLSRERQDRPAPAYPAAEGIEEVPVIGLRRRIGERMQESKRRIPHFCYVEEADVTALEALRQDLNQPGAARPKLTLLPFLIRALVRSLAEHPAINAHFDDEAAVIRRFAAVHVGIATQTPRGLVVPVIRHAESRDLWQIADEIKRLSEAARAGKAGREELSGSTITVSSLGTLGGIAATPIINPPEVAIVGINKMVERPIVRDGRIAIARMMNLSSSFDHRIIDGFDAASFIQTLIAHLQAPGRLLVD